MVTGWSFSRASLGITSLVVPVDGRRSVCAPSRSKGIGAEPSRPQDVSTAMSFDLNPALRALPIAAMVAFLRPAKFAYVAMSMASPCSGPAALTCSPTSTNRPICRSTSRDVR